MIELPEARTYARDLESEILNKKIIDVGGNFTDHKFTFYNEPETYKNKLVGKKVTAINPRNFYVEIEIEDKILLFRDGANIRYFHPDEKLPKKSKLLLTFDDDSKINVTTSMYSMIYVYDKNQLIDNEYYLMELDRIGGLDEAFTFDYFKSLRDANEKTKKLSGKAFLATEQRILGVGNGVVQDILFCAGVHPKRKINTLDEPQFKNLYQSVVETLTEMTKDGGRDTEKNLFGECGGYPTIMSKNAYGKHPCPRCGGPISKENYLGGSIYYCPICQPLNA